MQKGPDWSDVICKRRFYLKEKTETYTDIHFFSILILGVEIYRTYINVVEKQVYIV